MKDFEISTPEAKQDALEKYDCIEGIIEDSAAAFDIFKSSIDQDHI